MYEISLQLVSAIFELQIKSKGQHARMIERRGAILRHTLHTMKAQLAKESIGVTFPQLLAECIFAGNALTNIGGGTPYNARLGSQPAMLLDLMALQDTNEPLIQINNRIRQVSLEKIITATAIARINRASNTTTTPSGEEIGYQPGELLDQ